MKFLQSKNGMERASFDAVWPHLPCLPVQFKSVTTTDYQGCAEGLHAEESHISIKKKRD